MNIIAIANQKGGVAKTTTAVNLSAGLVKRGQKVLLVDSDPQANATVHLGFNPLDLSKALDNLYYEEALSLDEVIQSRDGLSVIPAGEPLAYAEQKLAGVISKETILREKLEPVKGRFDYMIIDCPPNLGFLTLNAFTLAKDMIVVLKPEYFSLEGLKRITRIAGHVRNRLNSGLQLSGYLLANFDARKNQHKGIRKTMFKTFPDEVFSTVIRTNSKLSNCTSKGQTIFEYAPKSFGAVDYLNLAKEVEGRYGR